MRCSTLVSLEDIQGKRGESRHESHPGTLSLKPPIWVEACGDVPKAAGRAVGGGSGRRPPRAADPNSPAA